MSVLESKINSIGAIAIGTEHRLTNNYYDKAFIDTVLTAGGGGQTVNDLLLLYYNKVTVNSLLSNYQTVGNYLTSGSLMGYVTTGSIPNNYLTNGSLIGYLTSGSLLGYVTTGSIPTNYLTSGSLIGYATSGSIPNNYLTSGSLIGYAPLTNPVFIGTITTNFLNMIIPTNPNDIIINDKFIPTAPQLLAQLALSGGGIVSWNGTHLKWASPLYTAPVSKPDLALDGFYSIDCPPSGRLITRYAGSSAISVTTTNDGIPLSSGEALYWFIPPTAAVAGAVQLNFFIVNIDATTFKPTGRTFLIAVNNPNTGLKWMPGQMTIPKDSGLPATYNSNTGHVSWLPTIGSIPTSFLTSGSLIGYLTSGSLIGYATTGSIPTDYLTSGSITPITSLGADTSADGYRVLNPSNQYQTRALRGANYIDIVATNTQLTIQTNAALTNALNGKQNSLTVTGNDAQSNFRLLDDAGNVRSLQAGGYVQVVRDNTTLLITASSALQTALNGKQPSFTVSGDDVSSFRLLRSNFLASIGSSDTVVPVLSTNADGTPLIKFNSTLDVGSLTGYAPTANPSFTGTANFYDVTSITGLTKVNGSLKDLGLANYIALQLSIYAPLLNPQFTGTVRSNHFNAATSLTIMGNTVASALQISNTLGSYLTSAVATNIYATKDAVSNTLSTLYPTNDMVATTFSSYLTLAGATSSYATKSAVANTLTSYLTLSGATFLYPTKDAVSNTLSTLYPNNDAVANTFSSYLTLAGATSSYATKSAVANTLTSYLTLSGATSLYPTKDAVSTTLTSYLTSTVINNTYAPLLNPSFNGTLAVSSANFGQFRALPTGNGGESSIGFYRNPAQAGDNVAGGVWTLGHNAWGVGQGNFAIGTFGVGRCLSISSSGVLTVQQPAIFNSSLTLGGNNLQDQLNNLAPKSNPTFTGNITTTGRITVNRLVNVFPNSNGDGAEISFYRNADMSGGSPGDGWAIGHAAHGVGAGNFAIGTSTIGRCLSISSTGVLNVHQPAIFNSSLTLGGNNLQNQLNTLAPKDNPTFTGMVNVNDITIGGRLLFSQFAAFVSPTLSLNTAWAGGQFPIFSRLGRWTGNRNGGNIILRVAFALADYGTPNSIGELTLHYTLGREQPCTNNVNAICYGDGFVLSTSGGVWNRNIYVVPVSNDQTFATMDFWVDAGAFPGHRLTCIYTGNASTRSGALFGDSVWIPEQDGAARVGGDSWPPPNGSFGYTALPNPVPYLTLQNAINYTSLTPPPPAKSLYAGVFKYNGTEQEVFQSHGAIVLAPSRLTRASLGSYQIILPQPLPSNSGVIATSNSSGNANSLVSAFVDSNIIYLRGIVNGGINDIQICFSTVP